MCTGVCLNGKVWVGPVQEEGCFRNYVELGSTCQSSATAQEKEEEPREAENQWEMSDKQSRPGSVAEGE